MHSAILDIYIYRQECVTSQTGKSYSVSGHFHNKSCTFTFFCSKLKNSLIKEGVDFQIEQTKKFIAISL